MKVVVVSFYMDNIPSKVLSAQREVMKAYGRGFQFHQMYTAYSHARSMDYMMREGAEWLNADGVIFLDIDAIPTRAGSLSILWDMARKAGIAGAPQRSNHITNGEHIFVAPSVMAIRTDLWREIGKPSAEPTRLGDVAESYTYAAEKAGVTPSYLDVLGFEKAPEPVKLPDGRVIDVPHWDLKSDSPIKYGLNTTFGLDLQYIDEDTGAPDRLRQDLFFHSFQSWAPGQQERFVKKCQEVLL